MSYVSITTMSSAGSSTDTLVSAGVTTSGTNRHIDVVVGIGTNAAIAVSAVTRTGTTFTHQRSDLNTPDSVWTAGEFWMTTAEPPTDSAAVTIVLDAAKTHWGAAIVVFDDVDQTTRIRGGTVTLNSDDASTVANLVLTSETATGDTVISAISAHSGTLPTTISGDGTFRSSWSSSTVQFGGVGTADGAASVTLGWDGTPFRFVHYAASHPPPSGTAPVLTVPGAQTATLSSTKSISGFSFTDTESDVVTITASCEAGATITFDLSSTSVTDGSTNGTNTVSLSGSNAELSTVLGRGIDMDRAEAWPTTTFVDTLTVTVIDDTALQDADTVSVTWTPPTSRYQVLTGTPSAIITALQALSWTPPTDATGLHNVRMVSATSADLTDTDDFTIDVLGNSPVLTVPSIQAAQYDVAKAITGISVAHADGLTTSVLLECPAAMTMTVNAGATGATVTGSGSSSVLVEDDNEADINTVLTSLQVSRATPVTPSLSNLNPASMNTYEIESNLQVNDVTYTDRAYIFESIPSALLGAAWIQTPNDDKASSDAATLAFDIDFPAWVYITRDRRSEDNFLLPAWMATWEYVNAVTQNDFDGTIDSQLYRKSFPAGTVTLGGYDFGVLYSHYTVVILPIPATIPITVTATDSNGAEDIESFNVAWSVTGGGGELPLLDSTRGITDVIM